jgi:hypothetical protein
MKLPQCISMAIVTALALWASNANAIVLEQFTKLSFSLVAAQQVHLTPIVLEGTIKTSKITNKDLLSFLATALNTNWPAGAQLAVDNSGDIYVVDKTGTNGVFDLTVGMNVGDTNVVYFSVDYDATLFYSDKSVFPRKINKSVLSGTTTQYGKIFFHLFNEQNGITNTDLCFDGLNVIETHSNMVGTSNGFILHSTTSEQAPVTGDGTFNLEWTVIKGEVTSSSKRNWIQSGPQPLIQPEP